MVDADKMALPPDISLQAMALTVTVGPTSQQEYYIIHTPVAVAEICEPGSEGQPRKISLCLTSRSKSDACAQLLRR
jgi:hypothetical protein